MGPVSRTAQRQRSPRARREPDPAPGRRRVDTGVAELLGDADRFGGWLLTLDGTPQSYVDLVDPTHLEFDYMRHLGDLVDVLRPSGEPLRALHLGGGACTLARYIEATRPGSRQLVVEVDGALVELVRGELGLPRAPALRVRVGDARDELATRPRASAEVVVCDVYGGGAVPASVSSREFGAEVARVLRPGGALLANVADGRPLSFARGQVATLQATFPSVLLVAAPGVLAGRRWGNLVLAASAAPLPLVAVQARSARSPLPSRVLAGAALAAFVAGAPVATDGTAAGGRPIPGRGR